MTNLTLGPHERICLRHGSLAAACLLLLCGLAQPAHGQYSGIGGPSPAVDPFGGSQISTPKAPETPSGRKLFDQPISDIIVEGNISIPSHTIEQMIKSRVGRPAYEDQIREDVRILHQTGWFISIEPRYRTTEDGGLALVLKVVERPRIRSVEFRGNDKIKTKYLEAETGLRVDGAYDVSANKLCVHRLVQYYKSKGFLFAEVKLVSGDQPEQRDVIFEIKEGPKVKISSIKFEGNESIRSAILKTKLSSKAQILWTIGGQYDPEEIPNDVDALDQYYRSLGYFDVKIDADTEFNDDRSRVTLRFKIDEGVQFRVRNVAVVGNDVIPTEQLLKDCEMLEGDPYLARIMKQDVQSMKDQYDELGRLFARVEPVPSFLQKEGVLDITYQIDEDRPRYIGDVNITIQGDSPHTKVTVPRHQATRYVVPGTLAKGKDIQAMRERLYGSPLWDRANPPQIDIRPSESADYLAPQLARGQSGLVETTARHTRGLQTGHSITPAAGPNWTTTAEQLTDAIKGMEGDDEAQLRRELDWLNAPEHDTVLDDLLFAVPDEELEELAKPPARDETASAETTTIRGQSPPEMYRGQSFDPYGNPVPQNYLQGVSPQGDPYGNALNGTEPPGFVDIDIALTEARTGRFMFGAGVNSDAGVVGNIVLEEQNFDIMRFPTSWADIMNGKAWRGGGQSFRLEAVPGSQVSRYLASWQDPFFLGTDFNFGVSGFYYTRFFDAWAEERLGGRISLGRLLSRNWSVSTALRLEDVLVRDVGLIAPPDLRQVEGHNFLSTGRVAVAYDTRDSAFMPTKGNFVEVGYEQGFGEFNYPRFDVTASQFFTTYQRPDGFGKHIFMLRGQVGWTGDDTPIFERYYAGGFQTFRGFAFRGVSPIDTGVRVGGQFLALGTAEYMIPITATDNVRTVVFSDFGTVEEDIGLDSFRVSAGFGFRLSIPAMGPAPIALDFAWPILSEVFDDEQLFSFYVGFTR